MIKTVSKVILAGFAAILGLIVILAIIFTTRLYASLPQTQGTLRLDGLNAQAHIIRDPHGVPHIFASSDHDAFFAMGVAHAQDRLWQMEITRRAMRGRVAELIGQPGVETDIFFRTMGLAEAAQSAVEALPADVQDALDAYAQGVNSVAQSPAFMNPPEFQILMIDPEPWTPADTVLIYKAIALDLFGNAFSEPRTAELLDHLGEARLREFLGRYPDDAPRSLSMADLGLTDLGLTDLGLTDPGLAESVDTDTPPRVDNGLGPDDEGRDGSNNWVLDGSRTTTGSPILANDPHLALRAPAIWYLARLTTPDGTAVGVGIPGTPFLTLGRNDHIAWGFTNTGPDVGDLHAITEDAIIDSREEVIRVRFGEDITLIRRATQTGPVLDPEHFPYPVPEGADALALQWMLDEPDDGTPGVGYDILRARDWQGFVDSIRNFVAPQQSIVFAHVDGDIGFYAPARIPVRDETGAWVSTIPFDELPHTRNPERGFVATANNKIVPDGYPHYLTSDWYGVSRIRRIYEGIEAQDRHDMASMAALQIDTVSDMTRRILPALLEAQPETEAGRAALSRLQGWNSDMAVDLAEPLIFAAWKKELTHAVYADELGDLFDRWKSDRRIFLTDVFAGDLGHWCDDIATETTETCAQITGPALDRAVTGLMAQFGSDMDRWRWGEAHQARHAHTPFSAFPVLDSFFTIETPIPGDGSTVNVAHYSFSADDYSAGHGASYRALYDLSDLDRSQYMITTGQSGNPMSRHYDDLAPLWGRGEFIEIPADWDLDTVPSGMRVLELDPAG